MNEKTVRYVHYLHRKTAFASVVLLLFGGMASVSVYDVILFIQTGYTFMHPVLSLFMAIAGAGMIFVAFVAIATNMRYMRMALSNSRTPSTEDICGKR